MSTDKNDGAANPSRVDDLLFRFSLLSDAEQRQFHRKYGSFRTMRRQFGGVFERMKADRPRKQPGVVEAPK